MIKEKLQRVRHDMESLVKQQHIYHGHYQTRGVRICVHGSDCYGGSFGGFACTAVWSTETGGHSVTQLRTGRAAACLHLRSGLGKLPISQQNLVQWKHLHVNYGCAGAQECTLKIINLAEG